LDVASEIEKGRPTSFTYQPLCPGDLTFTWPNGTPYWPRLLAG